MRATAREAPETFGQYLLYEAIGRGGMATVRRAELRGVAGFRRTVALKQLHPHLAEVPEMVELFAREARLGSYLRHPNIAHTFDFGSVDGVYYMAMERIRGPTLAELARQCASAAGPIPLAIATGILTQLCDAFDYIHRASDPKGKPLRLVHCDVSPSNILVANDGFAKLIDFGIARAASATLRAETGMLRSRLAYVAPEYQEGKFDARSDLFSLGVISYELIANRPLFAGSGDELRRVREMPIPPLSRVRVVPHALQEVIMTALQRDLHKRWNTAAQMRDALHEVARGMAVHIGPPQVAAWVAWAYAQRMRPAGVTPPAEPSVAASAYTPSGPNLSGAPRAISDDGAITDPMTGPVTEATAAPAGAVIDELTDSMTDAVDASWVAAPAEVEAFTRSRISDLGLVPVARPDQSTLVVVAADARDPTKRIAGAAPASDAMRTGFEGSAVLDGPTTLRRRAPRPYGLYLLRRARTRLPRRQVTPLFMRDPTTRYPKPAAPRPSRSGLGERRRLAHTVPRALRTPDRSRSRIADGTPGVSMPAPAAATNPTMPEASANHAVNAAATGLFARTPSRRALRAAFADPHLAPQPAAAPASARARAAPSSELAPRAAAAGAWPTVRAAAPPAPTQRASGVRVWPAATRTEPRPTLPAPAPSEVSLRATASRSAVLPGVAEEPRWPAATRPIATARDSSLPAVPASSVSAALPRALVAPRRQAESTGVVIVAGTGREPPRSEPSRAERMAPSADPEPSAPGIAVLATLVALAALLIGYLVFRR